MKVQLVLNAQVIHTQLVNVEKLAKQPSIGDIKLLALKAALADRSISLPQSFQVSFRVFDALGRPIED